MTPPSPPASTTVAAPAAWATDTLSHRSETSTLGEAVLRGNLQVEDDFRVLDDPHEQQAFTRNVPVEEGGQALSESVLMVQGMYCAACAGAVEDTLEATPGVTRARVNAATRRLVLRWNPQATRLSDLAAVLGRIGYRVLPVEQGLALSARVAETRQALWRLFVAGICMMQVMMYAWPTYVTEPGDIPPDIVHLLRWASWVLSVPVLLFASGPFFRSAWRDLKHRRIGMDTPVAIGIAVTFVASSAATFDPSGTWGAEVWFDSLTMFVFFLLGGRYLEFKVRDRTAGALDALINRLPATCDRQTPDGAFETVSVRRLVSGDVVRVMAGQAFPGDGTLLSPSADVDEALLTGESMPVTRHMGDAVVAGSYNLAGACLMRLDKLGADTRFGQIVSLMERASSEKPRLAMLADRIAAPFLVVVLLAAGFAAWYWWPTGPSHALGVAVAVLIVTCPCALSLATPTAMLASAGSLARRGILVRRLQAFETLAQVGVVVFDKTGTLTQEAMKLGRVTVRQGVRHEQALALAAELAASSLHPVSRAIVSAAEGAGPAEPLAHLVAEVQELAGQGLSAPSDRLGELRLGSAGFALSADGAASMAPTGAGQTPCAHLSDAQGWLATFELEETLRDDAAEAVASLHRQGVRTWLMSGDKPLAAQKIADQLGIEHVLAEATPEDKLAAVKALQTQGLKVAMVGDGLNDGPVLACADVSFALGHAAPLAQAQSDLVIQSGRLNDLLFTHGQACATLRVVRQNLLWAGVYNAVSVPLAIAGWMPPWAAGLGMAGSSLWVIANAMRLNRGPARIDPVET